MHIATLNRIEESRKISLAQKFTALRCLIGNTPMIEIDYSYQGIRRTVFAKCEFLNLTGSIKDRMALHILEQAYAKSLLHEGDTIVEATSGNTGIAFSAIGRYLGHRVKIIMPDWLSIERKAIIKTLGAEVTTVSLAQGGFQYSIQLAEALSSQDEHVFLPRQFSNTDNPHAHMQTGKEIWSQLDFIHRIPDGFVAGVGTGGTIMGAGEYLKQRNPKIKLCPLEPTESPTLTTGYKNGSHRIQGISDEFIPAIVNLSSLNEIIQVNDGDAILAAQSLASTLGLGVGISSGANFLGAVKLQDMLGVGSTVVTVFSDCNKKYLSTDLVKNEPTRSDYLTSHIQLHHYASISRRGIAVL